MKPILPICSALAASLTLAHAHHGQEFFLLYDARVQQPLHGTLQQNFSFIDEGDDDSLSLSPSLSLGILPRTAFNLRADFSNDADQGWAYRSIEPGFQIDLTPPNLKLPIRIGFAASYQFGEGGESAHSHGATDLSGGTVAHVHDDSNSPATSASHDHAQSHSHTPGTSAAHDETGTTAHDHSTHYHPPLVETPTTEDPGPDGLTAEEIAAINAANAAAAAAQAQAAQPTSNPAPAPAAKPKPKSKSKSPKKATTTGTTAATAAHSHSDREPESGHSHSGSIHNHDDNLFTARLIFEADLTENTLLVGNLINVIPEGGDVAWGYAIGLRQRLRPGLSVGVEALGDFDRNKHQEVLGAVFWEPMHHVLLKVGVGTGLTAVSPDTTVRAGILWMF